MASPSATKEVLDAFGLRLTKRLGQHFLVDDGVLGRMLEMAQVAEDDVVLEVGPGIGTLTLALLERARQVVAIERDARFIPVLESVTGVRTGLVLVRADAMRVDLGRPLEGLQPTKLVSNLPYEVAATVVLRAFESRAAIDSATVMVQAEVAERMRAAPGSKDYGAYSVKLQLRARVAGRFSVSRSVFMPPPRVDSAAVRLERRSDVAPGDVESASVVADAAFSQRRKTLRNSLSSGLSVGPDIVSTAVAEAGFDPGMRAEDIEPEGFVELGRKFREFGLLP